MLSVPCFQTANFCLGGFYWMLGCESIGCWDVKKCEPSYAMSSQLDKEIRHE